MKSRIAVDKLIVTSAYTLDEIKMIEKYKPEALKLVDEDKNLVFKYGVAKFEGSISDNGIMFDKVDGDGKAAIVYDIPADADKRVDYVVDNLGVAIERIKEVEADLDDIIKDIKDAKDAVKQSITIA